MSITVRASESSHWYTREGAPKYTVEAKNGNLRNTTLADARKMNLVPSVTTIIGCAAKPGLGVEAQPNDACLHDPPKGARRG